MSGTLDDYDYPLPERLIASHPLPDRADSRMLVLDRHSGAITHRRFRDFPSYVKPDDLVVLNNSRVVKARVYSEDRRIEFLFLEELAPNRWKCLVRPGRKMRDGASCQIGNIIATVDGIFPTGERVVVLSERLDFEKFGRLPIPPYFHRDAEPDDDSRYQTVYAGPPGSVAAPTAGLHFTPEILSSLPHGFITLHVGTGTFQPVKVDNITDHRMHAEQFTVDASIASRMNTANRIIAVGTTTTRVLESLPEGPVNASSGSTDIFIHPPYTFRRVDALLTNFHLPKSTLIMLVSALAGREHVLHAYHEAIREEYRFFSYGDCMLVI